MARPHNPAGGRPALPESDRRAETIRVRTTTAESESIAAAAERAGVSVSEWSRRVLVRAAKRS
jgi:predicted HicB family RNase H-like nuclease